MAGVVGEMTFEAKARHIDFGAGIVMEIVCHRQRAFPAVEFLPRLSALDATLHAAPAADLLERQRSFPPIGWILKPVAAIHQLLSYG